MKFLNDKKGEITAFLSLVLLLVLSLIGTVIEGARVYGARSYVDRALMTSMDSILGEYLYPLYEDYHLFLLDGGYGTKEMDLPQMAEIMKEYMEFSLNPVKEYKLMGQNVTLSGMNLHDAFINNITIEDTIGVTELENKMFIHEAVGFMKYKLPQDLIEAAGEKHMDSKTSVQIADVMEKKMNLEESACVLSKSMLDLIRYVEGISADKKGIHYKGNKIKAEDNFVKKFCVGGIDKRSLNIANDIVFSSLKDSYKTPVVWLEEIIRYEKDVKNYLRKIESLEKELSDTDDEDNVKERRDNLIAQIDKAEKRKGKTLKKIQSNVDKLVSLSKVTQEKINEALKVIPDIEKNQGKASREVTSYEDYLGENKGNIDESLYKELEKDTDKMKDYINNLGKKEEYNLSKNRLDAIQNALKYNRQILDRVYDIDDIAVNDSIENIEQMISFTMNLKGSLKTYNTKDLWFDYSSLKIEPKVKNPVNHYKELINEGVLKLVIKDLPEISKKELTGLDLPSELNGSMEKYEEELLSDSIGKYNEEGEDNSLKSSFREYAAGGKENTNKINTADKLLEMILLNEYMISHFKNEGNKANEKIVKETMLEYEQEYILSGNLNDYDNLSHMVHKLLFTRSIMNFVYLLTDNEKSSLAYTTAAALVGFTCLEPLISLTKTIILLVWAYEEALVDTSGLLENRYVPFLKNKNNFKVEYNELFLMNKQLIQEKVNKLNNKKLEPGEMNYDEYIRIFLYLTDQNIKCRRAMDLIQENIRYRYEDNFLIKNCIYGFKVKTDFYISAKFIKPPFVNRILNSDINGYGYRIRKDYSY